MGCLCVSAEACIFLRAARDAAVDVSIPCRDLGELCGAAPGCAADVQVSGPELGRGWCWRRQGK